MSERLTDEQLTGIEMAASIGDYGNDDACREIVRWHTVTDDYTRAVRATKTSVLLKLATGSLDVFVDAVNEYREQGWHLNDGARLRQAAADEIDRRIPMTELQASAAAKP